MLPLTACPRGDSQAASHGTCSAMRAPQILEDPCPPPIPLGTAAVHSHTYAPVHMHICAHAHTVTALLSIRGRAPGQVRGVTRGWGSSAMWQGHLVS